MIIYSIKKVDIIYLQTIESDIELSLGNVLSLHFDSDGYRVVHGSMDINSFTDLKLAFDYMINLSLNNLTPVTGIQDIINYFWELPPNLKWRVNELLIKSNEK